MNQPAASPAPTVTPYELVGGDAGLRHIVDRFYDLMDAEPAAAGIRAMHGADLAPMREKLFDWLSGWMGGPPRYMQRADRACIVSAHRAFPIGTAERDQWLLCMRGALADAGLPGDVQRLINGYFEILADRLRTH
ncbi:MAG: group II truncated hemoglobin [Gammaproteobacteria bacterium]